ncbi:hypothetical protein NONI108955_17090 [Nocardia ninae]
MKHLLTAPDRGGERIGLPRTVVSGAARYERVEVAR